MWMLALGLAHAELPPPDYRDAVLGGVESQADALIAAGQLDRAYSLVHSFRAEIADDARLVYEEGLILRLQGLDAEPLYRQAVSQDPSLFFAWYDLGELLLERGELDQAQDALLRATEHSAEHPQGWVGPMRLAELAGKRGDPAAFDLWLKEAIHRGFRFSTVAGVPLWRELYAQPPLAEVITRLATVYGEEATLQAFQ